MLRFANLITKKRSKKKGAILATAGFSIFALTAMAAASINIANLHQVSVELQNAADASALAGVTLIPIDPVAATPIIHQVAGRHIAGAQPVTLLDQDIVYGNYDLAASIFTPNATPFNAVKVTARRDDNANGSIGVFGGGLLGVPTASITRTALAVQDNRINGACVIPYAIHAPVIDVDNNGQIDLGLIVNIYSHQDGPTPNGNFKWLDFDFGSNPVPDLRTWLLNGFCGLQIPVTVPGSPGNHGNSTFDEFQFLVDQTIVMPVYHNFSEEGGNNGSYDMDSLVAVRILDVDLNGQPPPQPPAYYADAQSCSASNFRKICVEVVSLGSSDFEINPDPNAVPSDWLVKTRLAKEGP